jgi:hypothetical protein
MCNPRNGTRLYSATAFTSSASSPQSANTLFNQIPPQAQSGSRFHRLTACSYCISAPFGACRAGIITDCLAGDGPCLCAGKPGLSASPLALSGGNETNA